MFALLITAILTRGVSAEGPIVDRCPHAGQIDSMLTSLNSTEPEPINTMKNPFHKYLMNVLMLDTSDQTAWKASCSAPYCLLPGGNVTERISSQGHVISRKLRSYVESEQIVFETERSSHPLLWSFNSLTVWEANHISVTAFVWKGSTVAYPQPECCGRRLTDGGCRLGIHGEADVFVALTLMRWSTVFYIGNFIPGRALPNQDLGGVPMSSAEQVWLNYTRQQIASKYEYVCMFQLPKDVAFGEQRATPSQEAFVSHHFNRGVYTVPEYRLERDKIFHSNSSKEVECTGRTFNGTDVYHISSPTADNSTFTCMALWLDVGRGSAIRVECMPHNETDIAKVTRKSEGDDDNMLASAAVPLATAVMFLATVVLCLCVAVRRMQRARKQTIPKSLKSVMTASNPAFEGYPERPNGDIETGEITKWNGPASDKLRPCDEILTQSSSRGISDDETAEKKSETSPLTAADPPTTTMFEATKSGNSQFDSGIASGTSSSPGSPVTGYATMLPSPLPPPPTTNKQLPAAPSHRFHSSSNDSGMSTATSGVSGLAPDEYVPAKKSPIACSNANAGYMSKFGAFAARPAKPAGAPDAFECDGGGGGLYRPSGLPRTVGAGGDFVT